jgi:hypothetical protein
MAAGAAAGGDEALRRRYAVLLKSGVSKILLLVDIVQQKFHKEIKKAGNSCLDVQQ